jgi:hypothetical protein
MTLNKIPLYLVSVLLFMLVLPIASILFEWLGHPSSFSWILIGKWFVFWSVGIRLFIAGVRQVSQPAFTAKEIFRINGEESFPVIKELGFGNLSLGLAGILSLVKIEWCQISAIAGGLYFGLPGILHVLRKPDGNNETIAMVSDLFIFVIIFLYLFFTL